MEEKFHIRLPISHTLMFYITLFVSLAVGINTYFSVKQESKVLTPNLIHHSEHLASNFGAGAKSAFRSLSWIFLEEMLKNDKGDERCQGSS
jgi:hypothetical protein